MMRYKFAVKVFLSTVFLFLILFFLARIIFNLNNEDWVALMLIGFMSAFLGGLISKVSLHRRNNSS